MSKRILSILLAISMIACLFSGLTFSVSAETTSGECGDNLTWEYDTETATLTISGTGEMYNYNYDDRSPWNLFMDMEHVIICEGASNIGEYAFDSCTGLTSIEIPNSVASIGDYAIYGCTGLTSIEIPNSVTSIGEWAFSSCSGLTSIEIPKSATSIGWGAFSGCQGFTSIIVEEGNQNYHSSGNCLIETASKDLIAGCKNSVIPSDGSVTRIGGRAFEGCTGLTSIVIPNSITSIGWSAFPGCNGLTSITVEKGDPFYHSSENCLIETASNTLIAGCKNSVIPSDGSVTSIAGWAFFFCTGLTNIEIPNSITSIDEWAFGYCTGLTSIEIPNSVTSIGEFAFEGCTGLKDVYYTGTEQEWNNISIGWGNEPLSNATIHFSDGTVYDPNDIDCPEISLNEVKQAVISEEGRYAYFKFIPEEDGSYSFESFSDGDTYGYICDTELNTLAQDDDNGENGNFRVTYYLNAGTTYILKAQFYEDETGSFNVSIKKSTNDNGSEEENNAECESGFYYNIYNNEAVLTGIDEDVISGDVTIPSTLGGYPVTSIGRYAFYGCTGLTSITIPNSVTSIGDSAFDDCTGLTSIKIPDSVTSIGFLAFDNTPWYDNQPDGLVYAEKVAYKFKGTMPSNTSIILNDDTLGIADSAFEDCTGLKSITIPNSVTSIGVNAFYGCTGLKSLTIPNSVTSIGEGAFCDCTGLTSIKIPNSVTYIGEGAFSGCTGLKSITIPNSVISIGDYAFRSCTGLTSIKIPNSVTSIGDGAFSGCTELTSIKIPDSVTSIGDGAFSGCTELTSITVEEGNQTYHSCGNCLIETESKTLIAGCKNSTIPNDGSVISIGEDAFYGCTGLTSITIPNSITRIGYSTFGYCTGLTSIEIPGSVTSIGTNAFCYCTGLTSIKIPNSVTSIGFGAFEDCTELTSITVEEGNQTYHSSGNCLIETTSKTLIAGCKNSTIPNDGSVTSIGRSAFSGCTGLTSIEIPDSVTSIGEAAFNGCTGLTSIEIPNGVTSIDWIAFSGCTGLTNIEIPNSVTIIGRQAFYYCTGLTSVTIGNSVTSIGEYAFDDCTGLTSIEIPNSVTSIGFCAFEDSIKLKDVYYTGTEQDWEKISIGWGNEPLTNANIHYNYVPHTHTFGEKWNFDNANHWHKCSICGQKSNVSGHTWDSGKITKKATCAATGVKTYTCTVCKTTKTATIAKTTTHTWDSGKVTKAATCAATGVKTFTCTVCKATKTETIKKITTHTSDGGKVTTKATLSKAGTKTEKCKVCGKVLKTTSIAYPKTIKISATSYTYDGKVKKPTVSVKDSNNKTVASSNYTVTYSSGCKNVGKYSVKITFKGNYSGTKTFTYTINPKGTTVSKLTTPKTKQITVGIKKNATQTTGYQIQYSTSKTFASGNKIATVTSNKTTTKTLTGLTKGKTYYVRIRTYKTVKGTKYYSAWSTAKSIKTK